MKIVGPEEIRRSVDFARAIDAMREAVLAQSRGDLDTPMPMHLDLSAGGGGEVHIKSSYRKGGRHFALKVAGSYAKRPYGSIVLVSVETGETVAFFDDGGHLTDLRTAAVAAMVAKELGRRDTVLGILGTGVQARLQAELHAAVLPLTEVHVWGRARRPRRRLRARDRRPAAGRPRRRLAVARRRRRGRADSSSRRPPRARRCSRPPTSAPARTSPPSAPTRPASRSSIPEILRRASLASRRLDRAVREARRAPARPLGEGPRDRDRRLLRLARPPTTARASPSPTSRASAPRTCSSRRRAPERSEARRSAEGSRIGAR